MSAFKAIQKPYLSRQSSFRPTAIVASIVLGLSIAPVTHSQVDDEDESEFTEAHVYFELNDTDGDLGIHSKIDGDAWQKLEMFDHNENRVLLVTNQGRLRQQGLTEIFFESAEPNFDDLDPADFFARFPEGTYEIEGLTIEGETLESEAILSHVMPAPPSGVNVSGQAASLDCDAYPGPLVTGQVIIGWDAVTSSHPTLGKTGPIVVEHYQVVVEREEPTSLVMSIDVPPSTTSIEVPDSFIALGDEFKFEIVVRESTGNQTALETCFVTAESDDDETRLVTTPDKAASGGYGWAIFEDGTKQWVDGACRTQLEAGGLDLEIQPWTGISMYQDSGQLLSCNDIADNDSGADYSLVTTPDHNVSGDYGWIVDSDGEKQWVDGTCRAQLESAGLSLSVKSWTMISGYADSATPMDCSSLLGEI